ncbi:MAG: hypothetical protein H6608_05330 [Flavobacteriales bacterium]|nr:hypothetical protein [Bacteroidota bacterium]MCB9240527.1 hypothetical protein [Flavobacteriales bacterium]
MAISRIKNLSWISLLVVLMAGCQKVEHNSSNIRITHQGQDFILLSMHPGPAGEINCFGITYAASTDVAWPRTLKEYDSGLDTIRSIYFPDLQEYDDLLRFGHWSDGTWTMSEVWDFSGFSTSKYHLWKVDENFQPIKSIKMVHDSTHSPDVNDVKVINGTTYLSWEEWWIKKRESLCYFAIYDEDLNETYRKNLNSSLESLPGFKATGFPKITPTSSGEVYYSFLAYFTDHLSLYFGKVDARGKTQYEEEIPLTSVVAPIGIGVEANTLILSAIEGPDSRQIYYRINRSDGKLIDRITPVDGLVNATYDRPNPLEEVEPGNFGQLLCNPFLRTLQYVTIGKSGLPQHQFDVPMPDFDQVIAYRSMLTANGSIVIGLSYEYNNEIYFELKKFSKDGKLLDH